MKLEGILQDQDKESNKIYGFRLSLKALAKSDTYNTIKIKGDCEGRDFIILIDSGSTHSFIDESMIKKLNVVTSKTTLLAIIVANGNVMLCEVHSPGFT
jgi:hypothetical protein